MPLLPTAQRDQVRLLIATSALALTALYWAYPHASRADQLEADELRVVQLEEANVQAERASASGTLDRLRVEAAENRSTLTVMRRLVPTGNEVPALLEEVSTAARRAGLDIGGVVPDPVIGGDRFDTYRYTITIMGGYHQLGEFLANIGSLPRIVAPVQFAMGSSLTGRADASGAVARSSGRKTPLTATVTLQTYVEKVAPLRRSPRERTS